MIAINYNVLVVELESKVIIMTLDQIETFIAIARSGSVRRASKVLNKSQPTVSASIKKLEEEINIELFNRDSYRVTLTEEGHTLFGHALLISQQVEQFKVVSKRLLGEIEPRIKIAVDSFCPLMFLVSILEKFKKEFSQTKLDLDFEVLGGAEEKLLNKESDIVVTPFIGDYSNVDILKICEISILPVANHSLVEQGINNTQFFSDTPQIIVKDSSKELGKEINYGINESSRQWLISDQTMKKDLILNGFGWGYLEASSITAELKSEKLKVIEAKNISNKLIPLYLCKASKRELGPATNKLWKYVAQESEVFNEKYRGLIQ